MTLYTLADLTTLTGAKRRTVQIWAEAGVIQAEPETERAGTGTHRRFSRIEAVVALIVNPLARMQVSIGELLGISRDVRRFLGAQPTPLDGEAEVMVTGSGDYWTRIEQCIAGKRQVYLVITRFFDHRSSTMFSPGATENPADVTAALADHIIQHETKEGAIAIVIPLATHLRVLR